MVKGSPTESVTLPFNMSGAGGGGGGGGSGGGAGNELGSLGDDAGDRLFVLAAARVKAAVPSGFDIDNALRVDRRICALGRGGTAEPAERSGAATGGGYILGIPCHNFFLRAPSGRLSALFANSYDGETTPHGLARSELTPK